MDFIKESTRIFLDHEICEKWPEIKNALIRSTNREPFAWKLPVLACQAVGGNGKEVLPALAAFTCYHVSIRLIDDLLDEDSRLESVENSLPRTANIAIAFNAFCVDYLLENLKDQRALLACKALAEMQLVLAYGQDLDVQNLGTEKSYWEIAHAKSGVYFASAFYVGALYGGADLALTAQLQEFGELYGEIMQIHDDLNDTLDESPGSDWWQGRFPLPILFAATVNHPDQKRFLYLRKHIQDPGALKEAQEILIRSGAISYAVNELSLRHAKAISMLDSINLKSPEKISLLLDEIIEPINHLFETVSEKSQAHLN